MSIFQSKMFYLKTPEGETSAFIDMKQYQLLGFGNLLRHQLVEKWIRLGRDQFLNEKDILKKT